VKNENGEPQIQTIRLTVNPAKAQQAHREVARLMCKSRLLRRRGYELREITLSALLIRPPEK